MRIAICDDDPQSLEKLRTVITAREDLAAEIHLYESGEALLAAISNDGLRFDALFIDMEMVGLNGIQTVNALRDMDDEVIVVFVTSYKKYMKECFQCRALRFVEKSNLDEELIEAIDAVSKEHARKKLSLTFSDNKTDVHLYYEEIYYIESRDHYLELHTKTAVYRYRSTLQRLCPP